MGMAQCTIDSDERNVGSHEVVLTATDGAGATATETFTIVVADTNDAPSITSTHLTTADEDSSTVTQSRL